MSQSARSTADAVQRLGCRDPTLECIYIPEKHLTDAEVAEMVDCLLAHPDVAKCVILGGNRLTDETGLKLAQYVASSSTIKCLGLSNNQLGSATYLAMATTLRVNTSLRELYLYGNQAEDESLIDAALISALRLNPSRYTESIWSLYGASETFKRLKHASKQMKPFTMLEYLAIADE